MSFDQAVGLLQVNHDHLVSGVRPNTRTLRRGVSGRVCRDRDDNIDPLPNTNFIRRGHMIEDGYVGRQEGTEEGGKTGREERREAE